MSFAEHRKILNDLKKFESVVPQMVSEMGGIALTHFTRSFTNQGFTDEHLERWKPRKRTRYNTRTKKNIDDTTRGILIGKGTAILMKLRRVNSGRYAVTITNNIAARKYANVHNAGLRAGRGAGFQMPKRQIVGYSRVMNRKIEARLNQIIKTVF